MAEGPDDIDRLFEAAGREREALDALDRAVRLLRAARDAKGQLAAMDRPALREQLRRRSIALSVKST